MVHLPSLPTGPSCAGFRQIYFSKHLWTLGLVGGGGGWGGVREREEYESVCKRGLLFGEVLDNALPGSHDINPCFGENRGGGVNALHESAVTIPAASSSSLVFWV